MSRQNIKQPILRWLSKGENAKIPVEKAYKLFTKETGLEVRDKAFFDYHKHYNAGAMKPKPIVPGRTNIERPEPTLSLDDIKINVYNTDTARKKKELPDGIFEPYKTDTAVDIILSKPGGVMKGTTIIMDGPAGVGKSTVSYSIQKNLKKKYPKANMICINSEMGKLDLQFERQEKEWMKYVDFFLLGDADNIPNIEVDRDPYEYARLMLSKIFSMGYDIILIDSWEDVIDKLVSFCNMTRKGAESFLLALCKSANEGENDKGVYTAIIAINQVTKDGVFVGSNKINHGTTCMLHLRFDERGERYGETSKNRRGGETVNKRMYYKLDEKGEVVWDEAEFKAMQERSKSLVGEKERMQSAAENFNKIFGRPEGDETIGGKLKKGRGGRSSVNATGDLINEESDDDEDE